MFVTRLAGSLVRIKRSSCEGLAQYWQVAFAEVNLMTQKKTESATNQTRGLLIAGASLLLLFGVAFLKGRAK